MPETKVLRGRFAGQEIVNDICDVLSTARILFQKGVPGNLSSLSFSDNPIIRNTNVQVVIMSPNGLLRYTVMLVLFCIPVCTGVFLFAWFHHLHKAEMAGVHVLEKEIRKIRIMLDEKIKDGFEDLAYLASVIRKTGTLPAEYQKRFITFCIYDNSGKKQYAFPSASANLHSIINGFTKPAGDNQKQVFMHNRNGHPVLVLYQFFQPENGPQEMICGEVSLMDFFTRVYPFAGASKVSQIEVQDAEGKPVFSKGYMHVHSKKVFDPMVPKMMRKGDSPFYRVNAGKEELIGVVRHMKDPGISISLFMSRDEILAKIQNLGWLFLFFLIPVCLLFVLLLYFVIAGMDKLVGQEVKSIEACLPFVKQSAEIISASNYQMSENANKQCEIVNKMGKTIDSFQFNAQDNAQKAREAESHMKKTVSQVRKTNKIMDSMILAMEEITETSEETERIVSTIRDIAHRTHVLTLNAAVEAARMGENGQGFSAIADEFQKLSRQCAEAAEKTGMQVSESLNKVEEGEALVMKTSMSFSDLGFQVTELKEMIGEIAQSLEAQIKESERFILLSRELEETAKPDIHTRETILQAKESLRIQTHRISEFADDYRHRKILFPSYAAIRNIMKYPQTLFRFLFSGKGGKPTYTLHQFTDRETGILNRPALSNHLRGILHEQKASLYWISLDSYEEISTSLDPLVSHALFMETALRIKKLLEKNQTLYRVGLHSFAVLSCEDEKIIMKGQNLVQTISRAFAAPFSVMGNEICLSPAIGVIPDIREYPEEGSLFASAQKAAYYALLQEKEQVYVFYPGHSRRISDMIRMEKELKRAVEKKELFLLFQPVFDLFSGKITGLEALLRWDHPTHGILMPKDFLPVAEESGLIITIGEWVMEEALGLIVQHMKPEHLNAPFQLDINVSEKEVRESGFAPRLHAILKKTGVHPEQVKLEIQESIMEQNGSSPVEQLKQLKEIGVHLGVDNFACSKGPLDYLAQIPFDAAKIDSGLILENGKSRQEKEVVANAIATMAETMNMHIVAKGLEAPPEFEKLKKMKISRVQGYFYSRPRRITEIIPLIEMQHNKKAKNPSG